MENFLLILDEIDDAVAVLRSLWPQLLGFLAASGLFALSIVAVLQWPGVALVTLLGAGLLAALPSLRNLAWLRFRTDP